jgi:DtxR family Mn-dependent transcriptional regulator
MGVEREHQALSPRPHSPNMEDYLEAIRVLTDEHGAARVTQLSEALQVSKPSVTAAVAKLAGEGLVRHEKYGAVELTRRGVEVADDVWRRHEALWTFLTEILGVGEDAAQSEACKLEHYLSPESSARLIGFVDHVLGGQPGKPQWLEEFLASDQLPGDTE